MFSATFNIYFLRLQSDSNPIRKFLNFLGLFYLMEQHQYHRPRRQPCRQGVPHLVSPSRLLRVIESIRARKNFDILQYYIRRVAYHGFAQPLYSDLLRTWTDELRAGSRRKHYALGVAWSHVLNSCSSNNEYRNKVRMHITNHHMY